MKLLMLFYMLFGVVIPNEKEDPRDRQTYTFIVKDKKYEFVYEEEIIHYYRTGKFEYNEDLD